jgi:choline transporter-like protein 2/4/5
MQDNNRKCRDCLWIGIFGAFWVGMLIVAMVGVGKGDPARLFYGIDYEGTACSVEGNKGKDYVYYPRLAKDLQEAAASGTSYEDFTFYGICFDKCPQRADKFVCNYDQQLELDGLHTPGTPEMMVAQKALVDTWFDNGPCWPVVLDTSPTFFRCFDVNAVQANETQSCIDDDGAPYETASQYGVNVDVTVLGTINAATDQAACGAADNEQCIYSIAISGANAGCDLAGTATTTTGALIAADFTFTGGTKCTSAPTLTLTVTNPSSAAATTAEATADTGGLYATVALSTGAMLASTECNNMDAGTITKEAKSLAPGECLHYRCTRDIVIDGVTGFGSCASPGEYVPNDNCKVTRFERNSVSEAPSESNPLMESMTSTAATIGMYAGDAYEAAPEIALIGGLLALVLGFVVLLLFKYFAGVIVWGVLVMVVVTSGAMTFYCSHKAGMLEDQRIVSVIGTYGVTDASEAARSEQGDSNEDSFKVLAYIMAVITVMLLFAVCMLAKKVRTCIEVIRAASGAIRAIPVLVIWPVVPFLAIVILILYFCLIAAYIGSAGDLSSADVMESAAEVGSSVNADEFAAYNSMRNSTAAAMQDYSSNEIMRMMLFYHFFGLLWTNALINAISLTTVAGAVCRYYWSGIGAANPAALQESGAAKPMGRTPVWSSFYTAIRYHLGSMCLGALIIAVVQALRAALAYIDQQTKNIQKSNMVVRVLMKVVQCCMWCLEKCLKFISRNAYIVVAMRGDSFCYATMRAFKLIFANMATVGVVNVVSAIILFLSRVMITCACGFFMFTVLDDPQFEYGGARQLSQPLFPVLVVLVMAYAVSTAFMNTFDLAIDTILLCFCEDVEINKNGGEMFASKALQKIVGHTAVKKVESGADEEEKEEVASAAAFSGAAAPEEKAAAAPEVAATPVASMAAEMDA